VADEGSQPTLLVTLHPLQVTGSKFRAGERVTVVVNVPPRMLTERSLAADDGSFIVDFPSVEGVPRGLRVRAMGSEGSAAIYAPRASQLSPPSD
jgi:hypothetical protein